MRIIVGLGNPGTEYDGTRHNAGRMALEYFRKKNNFPAWEAHKKLAALVSEGKLGKEKVLLVLPETFMNKSGRTAGLLVRSAKAARDLVVVYDDLDLPLGFFKLSFGRSSGGHNGLESIIRTLKTKDFPRVRIGVAPATPSGKIKKPSGEKKVVDFLLGSFSKKELEALSKIFKKTTAALECAATEGYQSAMNQFN